MVKVTAEVNGTVAELSGTEPVYSGALIAPVSKSGEGITSYELTVAATGDNGGISEETRTLLVESASFFPLEFIAAKPSGEEIDFIREENDLDIDLGDTNDFELRLNLEDWNRDKFWYGNRIFAARTEYGGIIDDIRVLTQSDEIVLSGPTWRGMLEQKVVQPPDEESHIILNGELNDVLRELVGVRFGSLFAVPDVDTGIVVTDWKVARYVTLYSAVTKLLEAYGCRLQIAYVQPEGLDYGYVSVQAVTVNDYSEDIEYSQESKVNMDVRDHRGGINHLVCVGTGQNEERLVLHLYVQEDGTIGQEQYYFGLDEREAVYIYTSADLEDLWENGTDRLKELQNYKQAQIYVDDVDLEIGDIISGYEIITGMQVKKPIIQKILKISNGDTTIEYKVKGDD